MRRCNCGFDLVKAHLEKRRLISYALIPHESYTAAVRREHAILEEKDSDRKDRMIANASRFVGSLTQCPLCGSWLFDEPRRPTGFVVLRKTLNAANKTAQRTGASRSAHKKSRTSRAAGSRR